MFATQWIICYGLFLLIGSDTAIAIFRATAKNNVAVYYVSIGQLFVDANI